MNCCGWCGWPEGHHELCPTRHGEYVLRAWSAGRESILKEPTEPVYSAVADGSPWHTAWLMGWIARQEQWDSEHSD